MLVKTILVFLLAMALVGMTYKALTGRGRKRPALDQLRCATCGRVHTSNPPERCSRPDCGTL
jgi:hypothetical protein